ncbi:DUF302 domain-containing protein [Variovorax sp. MHTC-1]|uniref:DUF302 domain-containing protein n=1 Tax=Variovorax sp. MHTC-1 TaxID=2495593 RepID=UPI000F85B87D|nr:DUF302 domain-containing protein [Variovorax sp. MHTC-1]RST50089.1 DUF302 domain-containing protein [Variovorax sp. MHTC-1]
MVRARFRIALWVFLNDVLARLCAFAVFAAGGLIAITSPHSPAETASRLEAAVKQRGLTVFARIDHVDGASAVGQTLRPTEVFIFDSAQAGTPFMECQQTVGIDLPLKALIWQDANQQTWFGFNDPAWLARRHGADACPSVEDLTKALADLGAAATSQ